MCSVSCGVHNPRLISSMAEFNLPEFYFNPSKFSDDIARLIKIVKPDWNLTEIEHLVISGGYSCYLYRVCLKSQKSEAVVLRVRNMFADCNTYKIVEGFETKIIQIVSKLGLFPKVVAIFQNGYCYEYIDGKSIFDLTSFTLDGKKSFNYGNIPYKLIAQTLAKIHSVKLDDENVAESKFFSDSMDFIEQSYPSMSSPGIVDKQLLHNEYSKLLKYSKHFNFKSVLCHGDPHPGNIVWNAKKNTVTFMDWELTHIGIQAFDVTYFLSSLTNPEMARMAGLPVFEKELAEHVKNNFVRYYLQEYCLLNNLTMTEDYILDFTCQVKFCTLIWCLRVSAMMGVILTQPVKIAHLEKIRGFGVKTYELYNSIKDEILVELNINQVQP